MSPRELKIYCELDETSQNLLKHAVNNLNLSARQYSRILKVARTIADMAEAAEIRPEHLSEAIQYRLLDRTV